MNWLDFAIIALIVGFVLAGYAAGLIHEVITLIASIAGIVIAGLLYDDFATDILVFIDDQDVARTVAFFILSGAVYLMGQILAYVLKRGASLLMLGWADHIGGAFFGLIKGLFIVQILLIVLAAYPVDDIDTAIANSEFAPYFIDDISLLLNILPGEFEDRVNRFLQTGSPEG